MNLQAVSRQQHERAVRAELSEAQKKRRRRPCFNPAASKRRRRIQAAMDEAVARPLTITFEPLDELLAGGWDVVEYDPEEECATPPPSEHKQKKVKREAPTPVSKAINFEPKQSPSFFSAIDDEPVTESTLKSPMGAAAARAGALMKNIVSSVGTAFGYCGVKKYDMINGKMGKKEWNMDEIQSAPQSPATPPKRRSTREKSMEWRRDARA